MKEFPCTFGLNISKILKYTCMHVNIALNSEISQHSVSITNMLKHTFDIHQEKYTFYTCRSSEDQYPVGSNIHCNRHGLNVQDFNSDF